MPSDRLGLFPLPLVLVPTERLPLHIFEPRYRELIGECVERGEEFGILLASTDDGAEHEVGTRAAVAEVLEVLSDGRMNILVEGGSRFRVLETSHERSFATASIEDVVDDGDAPDEAEVTRTLELFRDLVQTAGATVSEPDAASPSLDFEIVARVDFGTDVKQELLELTSPRRRYARLAELLERALEATRLERDVRERAAGNGKVTPLAE